MFKIKSSRRLSVLHELNILCLQYLKAHSIEQTQSSSVAPSYVSVKLCMICLSLKLTASLPQSLGAPAMAVNMSVSGSTDHRHGCPVPPEPWVEQSSVMLLDSTKTDALMAI